MPQTGYLYSFSMHILRCTGKQRQIPPPTSASTSRVYPIFVPWWHRKKTGNDYSWPLRWAHARQILGLETVSNPRNQTIFKMVVNTPGPFYPQDSNFNLGERKQLCLVNKDVLLFLRGGQIGGDLSYLSIPKYLRSWFYCRRTSFWRGRWLRWLLIPAATLQLICSSMAPRYRMKERFRHC